MNKSKFKAVRFKPFDLKLEYVPLQERWTNSLFGNSLSNWVSVTDSCIEAYPELFEVEKAEREFEYCACYKAKFASCSDWEVIRYYGDSGFARFGLNQHFQPASFHEIGEKIEL